MELMSAPGFTTAFHAAVEAPGRFSAVCRLTGHERCGEVGAGHHPHGPGPAGRNFRGHRGEAHVYVQQRRLPPGIAD